MLRGVVAALAVLVAGCGSGDGAGGDGGMRGAGPPPPASIRHDVEPLIKRFPAIGAPVAVAWVTWNSATGGVPAPTTYWIDAVVTLQPATTATLFAAHRPSDVGDRPAVHERLAPALPAGRFLVSPSLDRALSASGWRSSGFLTPNGDQLVISAQSD